jgi:hypothetical protein
MTTFAVLTVMALVFAAVLYGVIHIWHRSLRHKQFLTAEESVALGEGSVPVRRLLIVYLISGIVSLTAGFALLHTLAQNPPRLAARDSQVVARPITLPPSATRADLVRDAPQIKVVVDDSEDNTALPPDLLRQCGDIEITHVQTNGTVRCLSEGSMEAKQLLARGQPRSPMKQGAMLPNMAQEQRNAIELQGFVPSVASAPTDAAKEVSERKPWDRYAELVYFFLTFIGVFLRTYWDGIQQHRRRKAVILTAPSVITSLVIAIAVYALVIQSGLAGSSKLLTFSTGIFAVYNGITSPVILKDIAALRNGTASAPPTPPAAPTA